MYATDGEHARAAHHASELLELWANADPELQPRVQAMQRLLAQLGTDTPRR